MLFLMKPWNRKRPSVEKPVKNKVQRLVNNNVPMGFLALKNALWRHKILTSEESRLEDSGALCAIYATFCVNLKLFCNRKFI